MKNKSLLSVPLMAGAVVALLGIVTGAGSLFQAEFLTHIVPGGIGIVIGIVNPLLFFVIGLCFFEASPHSTDRPAWRRHAVSLGVTTLVVLPLGYLIEAIAGVSLGIDVVRDGTVATPRNPHPGRISPNASVAFLLTGVAFWLPRRPLSRVRQRLLLGCATVVSFIGFAGLAGHFLGLESLYKFADFNRILPTTAFGLLVVGAGLWALNEQSQPFVIEQAQRRIQIRALAVCSMVAVSCGIAGFAVMRDTFEQSLSRNMLLTATTNATSLGHTIDVSLWFPRTLATRPTVTQMLERLSRDPADRTATESLQKVADGFLTAELTGVEFYGSRGERLVGAGSMMRARAEVVHPLVNAGQSAALAWDGAYVLLAENPVRADGRVVGRVLTEQRLPLFDRLLKEVRSADATADAAICSRAGDKALCAATRFRQPSFELPLTGTEGLAAAAIAKALEGEQGVLLAKDPRGKSVLAAYAPIKNFGLGLGVKTDLDTLYAPLRARLGWFIGAVLLIIGLAIVALHGQVQPALARLVESEHKMKGILEEQSELVSLARSDGELVYVNPAYARHFGLSPAEMFGTNLFDHVEPADREPVRATIAAVLASGVPQTGENRMVTHGAAPRWVAWTNSVQRSSNGERLLHSVGRDVTERKAAEDALVANQAILERTGRVAAVGGWELDLLTRELKWTHETRRIHGMPDDFAPTLETAIAFYSPDSQAAIAAAVEECTLRGVPWDLELPLITAQGRHIWVRAQGQVEIEGEQAVRLVGAFQDITERKALEQRLADRERFIRKVTDSLPVRIAYVDREERFRFVNLAHCRRFGLSREQIIGRTRSELTGANDPGVSQAVSEVLQGREQRVDFEEVVDGKTMYIESRLIPDIGDDGEVQGFYTTGVDVTQRISGERALRELTTIFDSTPDYVVQTDWRGRILYMNPAVRAAVGLRADERITERTFAEFNTPETNRRFADTIVPAVKAKGVWIGETTVCGVAGRVVPVNHMVIAHRDRDGRVSRYSAVMRDISQESAARHEQQRQAATLRAVTEAIPAIVAVVGADQRYRFVNSAFERWAGSSRSAIVGRTVQEVLGRTDHERNRVWIERVLAGESVSFEREYANRNAARHLSMSYIPLWLDDGRVDGFIGVGQDITQHRQEESRLLQLTQRDALTGLLNRVGFEQFLEAALSGEGSASPLALLYVDLDHFKLVNDTHGHPVGDQVLRQFAQRLVASVRPTDAVARLGGDEFAIALTGVREPVHAQAVAEKVVAAAGMPFEVGALVLQVGASVGVAAGADSSGGWRDLVARADAMLYQAKAGGRGRQAGAV